MKNLGHTIQYVSRSYELPDFDLVSEKIGLEDDRDVTWGQILRSEKNFSICVGRKEYDAAQIYFSVLRDAKKMGWKIKSINSRKPIFIKPKFSNKVIRKEHIQKVLDLRVKEQKEIPTIRKFLSQFNSKEIISKIEDLPKEREKLAHWFDDIEIIPVENERQKEVFRYLRHSWRIPYATTPGRTLSFIVQKSNKNVVGIFTLASPTLWMSGRDESLGFENLAIIKNKGEKETKDQWIERWKKTGMLNEDNRKIHPHSGKYTIAEFITSLKLALIRRLEQLPLVEMDDIDEKLLNQLGVDLKITKPQRELSLTTNNINKRRRLYDKCFESLKIINKAPEMNTFDDLWDYLHGENSDENHLKSMKQGLREQKTHAFAGSLADISICGAIPPYNPLRLGKLVAMLTMSDFVSKTWGEKYGDDVSVIASNVAGRPINRKSDFAALATTGLYGKANIQYDRVKVGSGSGIRKMKKIGETGEGEGDQRKGPSTLTISLESWNCINAYCDTYDIAANISGKFGEGTSARLRQLNAIRASLISEIPEIFDKDLWDNIVLNPFSRSIHVSLLSRNSTRYLLGIDKNLSYIEPLPTVKEVLEQWKERWLIPLITKEDSDIFEKIKQQDLTKLLPYYTEF